MSRGAGVWQRTILEIADDMDDTTYCTVEVVGLQRLGRNPTRSEKVAIRRAMKQLALSGRILVGTFNTENVVGNGSMLLGFTPVDTKLRSTLYAVKRPEWHELSNPDRKG